MNAKSMNANPTISADDLVEYVTLSPLRRHNLLERAKYPALARNPWTPARALARRMMLRGLDEGELRRRAEGIRGAELLIELATAWRRVACPFDVEPLRHHRWLDVAGVRVTDAAPDVLLTVPSVDGRTRIGGLALCFEPMIESMGRIRNALMVGALDRMCGVRRYTSDAVVTIGLRSGAAFKGATPASLLALLAWSDIERACAEIRQMWSTV